MEAWTNCTKLAALVVKEQFPRRTMTMLMSLTCNICTEMRCITRTSRSPCLAHQQLSASLAEGYHNPPRVANCIKLLSSVLLVAFLAAEVFARQRRAVGLRDKRTRVPTIRFKAPRQLAQHPIPVKWSSEGGRGPHDPGAHCTRTT